MENESRVTRIAIIGGGISGLTLLHALREKFEHKPNISLRLYESLPHTGGTIHTVERDNCFFEWGPNGFIASSSPTERLLTELGETTAIAAAPEAKKRYIRVGSTLQPVNMNPAALFGFPGLSLKDKLGLFSDLRCRPQEIEGESVYDFGIRHFGKGITETFLDPIVSGIYAGDVRRLSVQHAFPRLYHVQREHGSIIRGMLKKRKKKPQNKSGLCSFPGGMQSLISQLQQRLEDNIQLDTAIQKIVRDGSAYRLVTAGGESVPTDLLYVCTPAHRNVTMFQDLSADMAQHFGRINYAAVTVLGLMFSRKTTPQEYQGYGYLNPSREGSRILGVLFEDQIWKRAAHSEHFLIRMMLGGSRHPEVIRMSDDEVINLARAELQDTMAVTSAPTDVLIKRWPQAIPQYDLDYPAARTQIAACLKTLPNLHLCANYWDGVSFNECIANAYRLADSLSL